MILSATEVLDKGRYLRRWARRLREQGFSPEDAMVLAYGRFGLDAGRQTIGVEVIVTGDLRLAAHFNSQQGETKSQFEKMTVNLPEPYCGLTLPKVMTTTEVIVATTT